MPRRIEITEASGVREGAYFFAHGDILTVDGTRLTADTAQRFINLGWAKDFETGEQGTRVPGVARINPDDLSQISR